ncbi:MAG: hypothetical protein GTO02_07650 [Candidatus Dadabacteria bacterium]|nr:hypothetical protein [Candidatus Dadabacteria bacterium]
MKIAKICRGAANVWFILVGISIFISTIGLFLKAPSFWAGLKEWQRIWSPYNLWNFLFTIAVASPGIGLWLLSQKLESRAIKKELKKE